MILSTDCILVQLKSTINKVTVIRKASRMLYVIVLCISDIIVKWKPL